jgi:hypothetical protein
MKYLTKKSFLRRYLQTPEYVSNSWITSKLEAKNPDLSFSDQTVDINTLSWDMNAIQDEPISFNCDFQLANNILTYKLTNTTENKVLANLSIPIDNFSGAYACTIWRISDEFIAEHQSNISSFTDTPQAVPSNVMVNSTATTLPTRAKFMLLPRKFNLVFWVNKDDPTTEDIVPVVIRPRLKSETPSADELNFDITYPETTNWANHTVTFTGNLTKHEKDTVDQLAIEMLPAIEITSSTVSGDVITVNFSTGTNISTLYLGQDVGYLPKTSVPVTNGTGSFKVVTTGLDTGEEVKVKMGHKYWSNQLTFTKTL